MSTNRSVGCSAATHEKDRSAVTSKKDRSGLCSFTFADGRRCCTPRRAGHPHLCFYHARREAQSLAAEQAGEHLSSFLSGDLMTAGDLSSALGRLFSAVAKGDIKPRTASTLAYLGQTLNPSGSPRASTSTPSAQIAGAASSALPSPRRLSSSTGLATPHSPASDERRIRSTRNGRSELVLSVAEGNR